MKDYDVIVIGGGLNGLTTACYLQKSGLSVGVFEARGQCGAHTDTIELGRPGFLHNTHAQWLVPAMSPAMADLELESFGLDLCGTDVIFSMPHKNGTNTVQGMDGSITMESIGRHSEKDAATLAKYMEYAAMNAAEAMEVSGMQSFAPPTMALAERVAKLNHGLVQHLGLDCTGDDVMRMSGYEIIELLFESEAVRVVPGTLGEYTGQWGINRRVAPTVLGLSGFMPMAVHQAKGGSHALTHSLVKCFVHHGGEIWTTCPVEKILVENGKAVGIRMSEDALLAGEEVRAKTIVSNITFQPTWCNLLGEEVVGADWMRRAKYFNYDDPQLLSAFFALKEAPTFTSSEYDPAIQRAWVGYMGCDSLDQLRNSQMQVMTGVVPDDTMCGYFIPTLADPTQAPEGCHTLNSWLTTPPNPRRWKNKTLNGWNSWSEGLGEKLGDDMEDLFESLAPGFKDSIIERTINTPMSMENSNPSAIRGNMIGGSAIPEQSGELRPLPGVIQEGSVSRTYIPSLYLSNSIHPFGATHLASGYLAAIDIAEDLGCREQTWWGSKPFEWFFGNMARIPMNKGVDGKWLKGGGK